MHKGELTTILTARVLIEFEGIIGHTPDYVSRRYTRRHRWSQLADAAEIDNLAVRVLYDLVWRRNLTVEVISVLGYPDAYTTALAARLDLLEIPGKVWAITPDELGARLIAMPHVAAIYTANPTHLIPYGQRARLITEDNLTQMGMF